MIDLAQDVIAGAQAAMRETGIYASVSLAQYGLESGWGKAATGKFNFFGIKEPNRDAPGLWCHTHEVVAGKLEPALCRFASYPDLDAAFTAHANLIAHDPRYSAAMVALKAANYVKFVVALAGVYATDPEYYLKILDVVESEHLRRYDALPRASS